MIFFSFKRWNIFNNSFYFWCLVLEKRRNRIRLGPASRFVLMFAARTLRGGNFAPRMGRCNAFKGQNWKFVPSLILSLGLSLSLPSFIMLSRRPASPFQRRLGIPLLRLCLSIEPVWDFVMLPEVFNVPVVHFFSLISYTLLFLVVGSGSSGLLLLRLCSWRRSSTMEVIPLPCSQFVNLWFNWHEVDGFCVLIYSILAIFF